MSRPVALVVLAVLLGAGPAWGLRATRHLDALETTLGHRAAALAGATDKLGRKQLKAAEKALARIDADSTSLADDLKLAKKVAGPVVKAFAADAEVIDVLTAAADAFEAAVERDAEVLERAREPLPDAKLTKKADRLLGKAEELRDKAEGQSKLKKRLSLLYKAQRSADKAALVLADALGDPVPTRLLLSPASALLTEAGETRSFGAVVLDQLERPMQATVSFASTNPGVAMVTGDGVVSGGSVGSAQILASVSGLETAVTIVNARTAEGAILVDDAQVASLPEPLDETAPYGVGFLYTVELFGAPPLVGDLLVGTGEIPLGGLVVEVAGADPALVTLEIRPLEELFTDLVIDEQIDSDPENLEVPADVLEAYDVEPGEDGAYVFVPREDVQGELQPGRARLPRGGVQGTVASSVGPFSCGSDITFPLGLNSPPTFSVVPNVSVDFQYSSGSGLERLVATGGATLTASYKPRLQAAVQGKITCRARLLGMTISVPGPIALIVGGYVPIGIGFEASGTVTVAQVGFDATFQDSFSVQVGVDCSTGSCEAVAGAPEPAAPSSPPPPPFRWVLPNVLTDFNVALGLSAYGYFELRIGNPLWETLQLKMVEGQAGVTQTANLAPKLTQIENTTSASSYKLSLYAKVGSGVSLNNILEFLNINVAAFEVKAELDVANSPSAATTPDGSLTFAGPVAVGQQVEATVVLKDVTYLGLQNVEEVRFYRKDSLVLLERAAVSRTQDGQTEYVARWTATASDLGEEFGVFVKTFVPIIEFEIEPNSLRTLEERELGWSAAVTFPPQIAEETNEALVVVVTNESGSPVAGAAVALSATGGTVGTSSGTTDSDGRFETTARLSAGEPALTIVIEVRETPGGELRASETVVATRSAFALDSFFWNTQNGCTTEGRCTTVFANTPTELSVTTTYADEYPNPACIGLTASAHAVVQTGPDGVVTIAGELRADETADCLDLHSQALIRFSVESSSFAYTLDVDLSQNPRAGGVALSRFHLQSFGVGISPVVCVPMGLNPTLCPDPPATTGVLEPGPYTIFARTLSESLPFTLTLTP